MDISGAKKTAISLLQNRKFQEARDLLQRTATAVPPDTELLLIMINALLHTGDFADAVVYCDKALNLNRDSPDVYFNKAMALGSLGQIENAKLNLEAALRIDPGHALSRVRLGAVYFNLGHHREALKHLASAVKSHPSFVEAHVRLGDTLLSLGRVGQSRASYRKALKIEPSEVNATAGLAAIAARKGEPKEAYKIIRRFLEKGNENVSIATIYADISEAVDQQAQARQYLERVLNKSGLSVEDRRRLLFSLGKLCDALEDYHAAFEHFRHGNNLGDDSFDPSAFRELTQSTIRFWNKDYFGRSQTARPRRSGNTHVFIVGMPRSGTSLIEQVIGSHPSVYAGGEMQEIHDIVAELPSVLDSDRTYPLCMENVRRERLDGIRKAYVKALKKRSAGGNYVVSTDKMPNNFWHLGLIQLLFPDAKVIHCVRDPMDTCLSCYFQNFAGHHPYANDLKNLGIYYHQYRKVMAHWKSVLDLPIMDTVYEEFITDTRAACQKLLEFCGLDWDQRVLQFHKTERAVVTASYDQVKKPVYSSSVGRWRNYQQYIEPLIQELNREV